MYCARARSEKRKAIWPGMSLKGHNYNYSESSVMSDLLCIQSGKDVVVDTQES